jgi:predicted nucleic acid-binding protein
VAKKDFVVDASIVTKWFLDEPDSRWAMEVRDDFGTGRIRLIIPTLLFYEVVNALRFSGEFQEDELRLASRSLSKYDFSTWRPRGRLLELTAELSLRKNLTVYDACYVALAQRTGSRLLTGDKELLDKFPAETKSLREYKSVGV